MKNKDKKCANRWKNRRCRGEVKARSAVRVEDKRREMGSASKENSREQYSSGWVVVANTGREGGAEDGRRPAVINNWGG